MDELRVHVVAVKHYLETVEGAANYIALARSRQDQLVQMISRSIVQPREASLLVETLRSIRWPDGLLPPLLAAVDVAMNNRKPHRFALQDFAAVKNYYRPSVWAVGGRMDEKLMEVTSTPIELGLKNPTEGTVQTITGVYLCVAEGSAEAAVRLSPQTKHDTFRFVKSRLKAGSSGASSRWIAASPLNHEFEDRVDCPIDPRSFEALVASIPMRISNIHLRQPLPYGNMHQNQQQNQLSTVQPTNQLMEFFSNMMKEMMGRSSMQRPRIRYADDRQENDERITYGDGRQGSGDLAVMGNGVRRAVTVDMDSQVVQQSGGAAAGCTPIVDKVGDVMPETVHKNKKGKKLKRKKMKRSVDWATDLILDGLRKPRATKGGKADEKKKKKQKQQKHEKEGCGRRSNGCTCEGGKARRSGCACEGGKA